MAGNPPTITDYYQALGLEPSSSQRDIKRAFRERAKRIHPDVSREGEEAAAQMRALLEAYETLSDPEQRREYDKRFKATFERYSFDYRSFLKSKPSDGASMAKLIFYDLLHGEEDEALDVNDRMEEEGIGFSLAAFLDREDAMDGSFLLAEEYEKRQRYTRAFEHYAFCVTEERRKPYFRHFFPEVELRIRELARMRLLSEVGEAAFLGYLDRMLALGFPRKEAARIRRRKAEILLRMGRREDARMELEAALALDKKLSGVAHLKTWTGLA